MQFIVLLHFPFLKNCGTKDLTQGLGHAKPVLLQNLYYFRTTLLIPNNSVYLCKYVCTLMEGLFTYVRACSCTHIHAHAHTHTHTRIQKSEEDYQVPSSVALCFVHIESEFYLM